MAIKITNKDVIQSYLMTVSKYDFSVYEKRILYRLVEAMQCEIEGKKLYPGLRIEKTLYDDRVVLMPISAFLANDDDENYTRVKKALLDLRNKSFEFDDGQIWKVIGIIEKPQFNYKRGWVRFEIQPEVYNAVLNFSKGFRKYELKTAMEFTSQYSMRFYELMSGQERPLIYTIEDLKIMFGVQDKYKRNPDFIKRIIVPAKEELDAKSPYSFEYKILKEGRSFHSLKLYPKYQPEHRDEELEKHELQKQVSLGWDLDRLIRNYLKQELLFTDQEIRNNIDLFRDAQKKHVLLDVFNSMGMPTSTTVSLVFELLGGTFALSLIKVRNSDTLGLGDLINTDKALSVIMAIFVSVAIAFFFGMLVQWLARVIFTFNYTKKMKYSIALFGGVAATSIIYFMLIKGLKDSSFIGASRRK